MLRQFIHRFIDMRKRQMEKSLKKEELTNSHPEKGRRLG